MNIYSIIILSAILIVFLIDILSDILNLSMIRETLAPVFEGRYDAEKYRQSQEYLRTNTRFGWVTGTFNMVLLLAFWFFEGFRILDNGLRQLGFGPVVTGIFFMGALIAAKFLVSLPFSVYDTFVIEERFGFNKTTPKVFIIDTLKGIFLGLILGIPLLALVLAFFEYTGPHAWFYCWVTMVIFLLALNYLVPTVIMPLFNRFDPIEEGKLRSAIMDYAKSIEFPLTNVFSMDGSKRSSKSNAFFTGFGKNKRIVLYDTLIEQHGVDELVGVLAHEMGHYKLKHILKTLFIGIIQTGIIFYVLSACLTQKGLFDAFYMDHMSVYAGLIFFSLLFTPIDFLTGILMNLFSRKNEFEADRFAVTTTRDNQSLKNALVTLNANNLGNLYPHPFYVFLHDSHPPVLKRIEAIDSIPV